MKKQKRKRILLNRVRTTKNVHLPITTGSLKELKKEYEGVIEQLRQKGQPLHLTLEKFEI
jgi:hypothetical protein